MNNLLNGYLHQFIKDISFLHIFFSFNQLALQINDISLSDFLYYINQKILLHKSLIPIMRYILIWKYNLDKILYK